MAATIRYVPERELPPYTYVPGRAPHPVNDPDGHSYAGRRATGDAPGGTGGADAPCRSIDFLWGVDLFNHGYYWEAHEAWEAVWNAAGRRGPIAEFIQGLIKLAAAGVKAREGRAAGVRRHTARAGELIVKALSGLTPDRIDALGVDPARALRLCGEMQAAAPQSVQADSLPRPLVSHRLELVRR